MRIINSIIFLLSLNVMAQNGALNTSEVNTFKTGVIKKSNSINNFSAEFLQTKHLKTMDGDSESVGKVYYQSPDMLKWEYTQPYNYQLLFKNAKLYILDDGHASEVDLSSNKLFSKMGELVAGSVNGKILQSDEDFDIKYHHSGEFIKAVIIPRDKSLAGMFKEIWINFNQQHLIHSVKLIDPSGDYTLINMKNIKINQSIPTTVFQK